MNFSLISKNKLFKSFKDKIEDALKETINTMGEKNALRDACEYSLLNGGKRFRPLIVLSIAKSLNKDHDVLFSAVACEFFHTASLIADDLPCMDDEKTRRDKPTVHLIYGQSTAILASYSLISAGYELIYKNSKLLENKLSKEECNNLCVLAIETVSRYAGIHGATGGQFLDLFTQSNSIETINEIIHKKTISLFEIAFVLGWLFGGGSLEKLDIVRKCSYHFGRSFQIADDINDYKEDIKKNKKINIAVALGKKQAEILLKSEIDKTKQIMEDLNIFSGLSALVELLEKSI
jgi:geranylgeranyl diphosphate synthase, type II